MTIGWADRLPLPLRFARRELRGGLKGFRIFLACLALGVAAIAAVGSIAAAVRGGLERDARTILGGDATLHLRYRPATAAELAAARAGAAAVEQEADLRAMARSPDGAERTVVELRAADPAYPLYGALGLTPAMPLDQALATVDGVPGTAIAATLAARLHAKPGDLIQLGDGRFAVRAVIDSEPDRAGGGFEFGPRALIALDALPRTGLVQPGSLIDYTYRIRLAPTADLDAWEQQLRARAPDAGWRIRDIRQATPGIERFIDRIGLFLALVGLTALLVGGVGVGNAVRAYLDGRTAVIATLKCLGAPSRVVFQTYLCLVLALALLGILAGVAVGALAPIAVQSSLGAVLPAPLDTGLHAGPLLLAAAFGVLTTVTFSLWPLARARAVPAAALFRDAVMPSRRPGLRDLAMAAVALAALVALAIATAADRRLAIYFVIGAGLCFVLFRLAAAGLVRLAKTIGRPGNPRLRLALANLGRPGAPTASIVLSLGLGLTLLVAIAQIEGNLERDITERLPARAPSFFFLDLQGDQASGFDRIAASVPGVDRVERQPMLRGRITKINGVPVEQAAISDRVRWAVDSDRGLTFSAAEPPGTRLVAGRWWLPDYRGPPLVSFDSRLAAGMHVGIGDSLTFNVLGVEATARIASLRDIDFGSLGINFTVIFAPGFLEGAPLTYIAVAYTTPAAEEPLLRALTDAFPNLTAIRVRDALDTVSGILEDIGAAARVVAAVTLAAGTLVLAGAMVAGHRRRVYDAVVLKVLGATRADIIGAFLLEYGLLGLASAAISAVLGSLAARFVLTRLMEAEFVLMPATIAATALTAALLTIAMGLVGTWHALGQKAAPLLRNP